MKKAVLALFFICFTLCSCSSATNNINRAGQVINSTSEPKQSFSRQSHYSHPEKIASQSENNSDDISRAGKIASLVRIINNVENAAVIIMDDNAVIGIDLKKDLSEDDVIAIKNEIDEKVKQFDSEIKKVTITTAPELTEELADLSSKEMDGAPKVSGELENILKRVTPTV